MVEKPLEDCQEAQQWMELIMRNQGLWHIPEQIFGYLNYETMEICRKVSELWNESLEKMALVKFIQEFGDRKVLRRDDTKMSTIIPGWKKAVKKYGAKSSIEDLQEIKDSLGKFLDETGKLKSCFLEPAHEAAEIGALKLLEFFLSIPYDMNSHNFIDRTVLAVACENGQMECVKLLIDATTDLNARDKHGGTTFHRACRSGNNTEVVKLLIEISTKYGIDLNARNHNGITALHWACQNPHTDDTAKIMIELSTKYGIDLNVRDNNGKTALHWACWNWNNPGEVSFLTLNGYHWSNIDLNDREHWLTKCYTSKGIRTDIVTMLLEHWRETGINIIKAQDNEGQTALDWVNLRLQWKNDDPELNKVKTILEEEYAKIDAAEV